MTAADVDTSDQNRTIQSIPPTMRAVDVRAPGGADQLLMTTVDVPMPKPGEVLIHVSAAGVNRPDILQRIGAYPPPPDASRIMGLEASGHIAALGEGVSSWRIGESVCALLNGGGYAEYVAVPAGQVLPVPDDYDMVEAAALPETLFTVWSNLFERAFVDAGDWVLVHGGTSGIGTMAVTLCRLYGIHVIVTCGSDDKCAAATKWGATHAINYRATDFVAEVRRITGGRGVDAVLDMVGGDYVARNLSCLAQDGRHVSIAVLGGATASVFIPQIMQRRLTLTGSTLRPRSTAFKALLADEIMRTVWPLVEAGDLRPAIDRTFPLDAVAAAHRRMESGDHVGKIVLIP